MVYFLSDLHLGATYIADPRQHQARVVRFLEQEVSRDATDLYLLGDVLDYWYEYRTVVPRGYVRFFGALARLADSGVKIHWFIGNHDIWLFDYLRDEIGIEVIDGSQVVDLYGQRLFLNHGDGVGRLPLPFRVARAIFRNRVCQKLYSAIHPRWTVGLAHRWSSHSREQGQYKPYQTFEGDDEPLVQFSRQYLEQVDPTINYFIYGHRHVAADVPLTPTCRFILLGEWVTQFTYARLHPDGNLDLLTYGD